MLNMRIFQKISNTCRKGLLLLTDVRAECSNILWGGGRSTSPGEEVVGLKLPLLLEVSLSLFCEAFFMPQFSPAKAREMVYAAWQKEQGCGVRVEEWKHDKGIPGEDTKLGGGAPVLIPA